MSYGTKNHKARIPDESQGLIEVTSQISRGPETRSGIRVLGFHTVENIIIIKITAQACPLIHMTDQSSLDYPSQSMQFSNSYASSLADPQTQGRPGGSHAGCTIQVCRDYISR